MPILTGSSLNPIPHLAKYTYKTSGYGRNALGKIIHRQWALWVMFQTYLMEMSQIMMGHIMEFKGEEVAKHK